MNAQLPTGSCTARIERRVVFHNVLHRKGVSNAAAAPEFVGTNVQQLSSINTHDLNTDMLTIQQALSAPTTTPDSQLLDLYNNDDK